MAEFVALPLWTDSFIADTTHLTAAETGAYICLLIAAWRRPDCDLPDDDKLLARWTRCDRRQWGTVRDAVMAFWDLDGGCWTQKRLTKERGYVADRREKRSAAGRLGVAEKQRRAEAKPLVPIGPAQANGSANATQTPSKPEAPLPLPSSSLREKRELVSDDDVVDEVWFKVKPYLAGFYGERAGGMVGRLLKNGNPRKVLNTMAAAIETKTQDPYPYMTQALFNSEAVQKLPDGKWQITQSSRQGQAWHSHAKRNKDESVLCQFRFGDEFIRVSREWPGQS